MTGQCVDVSFRGERAAQGPTTWGQREQWATMIANRPHDARFNMAVRWELPPGTSPDACLAALRSLIERHEILRTLFVEHTDAPPEQVVAPLGVHSVHIAEESAEGEARQDDIGAGPDPVRDLASRRFEPTEEFPVRFCMGVRRGRALWLGAALSHLAVDAAGTEVLRRDFQAALGSVTQRSSGSAVVPALQPLDQARAEQSETGRSASRRAAALWRHALTGVSADSPPALSGAPAVPAFPSRLLCARGLGHRARALADRLDVGVSAVFVAVAAAALAARRDADTQAVVITCGNRMARRMGGYAGSVAQQGVILLDSLDAPMPDIISRTWQALLGVHESSAYEPADVNEVLREFSGKPHVDHYVNFVEEDVPLQPVDVFAGLDPGGWAMVHGPSVTSSFLRYGVTIVANQEDAALRIFADGRDMPATVIDGVLESIRRAIRH